MKARTVADPVKLTMHARDGVLSGRTGRYEKRLADLDGLYRDKESFERARENDTGEPVYWVEDSRLGGSGELVTGLSVLEPGRIGDEFYMTRGHLHSLADRGELYLAVSGRGVMLLDDLSGGSRAIEIDVGEAVHVPGNWVHRSINVGKERFVTLFCYPADAGQDYGIVAAAGGMRDLVIADGAGWSTRPNPEHRGYGHV